MSTIEINPSLTEQETREEKVLKITHEGKSPLQLTLMRLGRNKIAMVSFFVIMLYVIVAVLTLFNVGGITTKATDFHYTEAEGLQFRGIFDSLAHPFGTDRFGRDVFARSVLGIRVALFLGFLSGLIMVPIAIVFGALAGYYGKLIDDVMVYIMSVIVAIPSLLLILSLVQVFGARINAISDDNMKTLMKFFLIAFAFAITGWVGLARVIRGSFIQAREFEYVLAAKALGASDFRIIFRHILPNVFHFVIVRFVLNFVGIVKSEVFLAYVGLSVATIPTWGNMITLGVSEITNNNWQNVFGATVFMFVFLVCLNLFGDALRDALDPKLRNL